MAQMSERFNFDDFDELIREALEEHAQPAQPVRRPGEIGSVICQLTLFDTIEEPTKLPTTE